MKSSFSFRLIKVTGFAALIVDRVKVRKTVVHRRMNVLYDAFIRMYLRVFKGKSVDLHFRAKLKGFSCRRPSHIALNGALRRASTRITNTHTTIYTTRSSRATAGI